MELVERAVQHSEAVAIRQNGVCWTYHDLLSRSARIAACLLDGQVDLSQRRVAILCSMAAEFTACQWAVWRAGGICVPLSSSATEPELEYAITDCQADTVILADSMIDKLKLICAKLRIRLLSESDAATNESVQLPRIAAQRAAMILYTSGTTNKPKGVVTTHANIEAQVVSLVTAWGWNATDRIPLFLPLHHIHGIINVLTCGLWSGAQVDSFESFNAQTILDRVGAGNFTLFMAVPTIYFKLIQALEHTRPDERKILCEGFANMRLMISGSAALPASVHQQWHELTGQSLLERYGMTEIGMAISNPLHGERRAGSVGLPLPSVDIRLISDSGKIIETEHEPGEIQVRGPTVFREYWNRPEATREAFDGDWFRTGDMAVLERGYYRIMGRLSVDIIKSGGYKLSALEIEEVLLQYPRIQQCSVVGLPDETWGECVAAAIVNKIGESIELEELRTWCRDKLSPYKIPKKMMSVPELPRNAMGKVIKSDVVRLFSSTK